ncbi:uncharacterized protein wu:fj19g03 [Danio aesculapii]|uniref:uncharacterized protein wu:fj19g03 n=1 Tax=Danio aesculapii TaxID=1142201 RepID=UPI0024C05BA4|nr:uncharacterized protein wu:fj19g03 [Danio aesculapii]
MNLKQASSTAFIEMKMLSACALLLLAFAVTHGRIVSKCELKEQLEVARARATGHKMTVDQLIASLVCNVENTSGFNTSLVTSIQIHQDNIKPPFPIPHKPNQEKLPAKEEDEENMEDEHIIPVHPPSHPKRIRSRRSVYKAESVETQGAKEIFSMWRQALLPKQTLEDSFGSGAEAVSEEESSGDSSSEEERGDVDLWRWLGIFQLSDRVACGSGSGSSLNLCGLECSALLDDDITDDITCLKTLLDSHDKYYGFAPMKSFHSNLLEMLPVKKCRSVVASKYLAECL